MRQAAQDAGVGRFEHILLCTDSMAEATVQTLPVRNCVVCSLSDGKKKVKVLELVPP